MGAFGKAGIGGVIMVPETGLYAYYGAKLSDEAVDKLMKGSANPIAQIEFLAILVAIRLWARELFHQSTIAFIDNEGTKSAMIKGSSGEPMLAEIAADIAEEEIVLGMLIYFERVPSHSNIADGPPRSSPPPRVAGWSAPVKVAQERLKSAGGMRPERSMTWELVRGSAQTG